MLRNWPINRKAVLVLSLPVLMTVAFVALLYEIGATLDEAITWSAHAQQVVNKIEGSATDLVVIHSENLQFGLLGPVGPAANVHERATSAAATLHELRVMVWDDPAQSALADAYVPRCVALLQDLVAAHDYFLSGMAATGAALCAANDRELVAVRRLNGEMRDTERALVLQRLRRCRELGERRTMVLLVGGFLTIAFVFLLGGALLHSMVWRLHAVREKVDRLRTDRELPPPIPAIDEIGRIDAAVHEMVRALRAQRLDNEMFIYSVSHDLRSPLVNLQGFSKELALSVAAFRAAFERSPAAPELRAEFERIATGDIQEALHFIDLAVQRQARIIDSLLSLSRAGRVVYSWTDVDLQAVVDALVDQCRNRPGLAAVEFVVGALPTIRADRDAIERVFDNLLDNAVKYLAKDRAGRIEVGSTSPDAEHVVVFVADNGIGIAADNLERVFMPFSRFGGGEGEGIGLSLLRRIVDRHHGRVWIESTLGKGTKVSVMFPRKQSELRSPDL